MPRLSIEARFRVISLCLSGYSISAISQRLREENVFISQRALYSLVEKYRRKGTVRDLPRGKRPAVVTEEMKVFIEEQLQRNDELTSTSIKRLLAERWPHAEVSTATIKRVRRNWVGCTPDLTTANFYVMYGTVLMWLVVIILCNSLRSTRGRGSFGVKSS